MKNLDIYINGSRAVHDDKTLVGSIMRNFDLTDPGNRKQLYTNTMKLPVAENEHIFKFASQPGYTGTVPYDLISVEIIIDGFLLVKDGIGYLSGVQDGYYILNVREQPSIIQTMKDTTLDTFTSSQVVTAPYAQTLLNSTSGYKLDFLFNETSRAYSITNPGYFKHFIETSNFTYYVHTLFSDFATANGITFAGGLMTDTYFLNIRMVAERGMMTSVPTTITGQVINSEKTFFNLFKLILQVFGAVYTIDGDTITIDKFDDKTLGSVLWNGKLRKVTEKKFTIPGVSQVNRMRFNTGGEAEETLNQSTWTCNNENIEAEGNLIEPDCTVYPFISLSGLITGASYNDKAIYLADSSFGIRNSILGTNFSTGSSITDIVLVLDGSQTITTGTIIEMEYVLPYPASGYGILTDTHTTVSGDNLNIPTYYNSQNDYLRLAAMIANPLMYSVEIDLNVLDLHDYSPFNIAAIPELAAEFYVNKFQFNFEQSGKASKLDIIKYTEP